MMSTSIRLILTLLAISFAANTASASLFNKENVIGAAIGGLAGGIIGHQSDHRAEGAIIGSVAGYAIGSVIQDEKQKKKDRRDRDAFLQHTIPAEPAPAATPAPVYPPEPLYTKSEERQILLQSSPLFSVR